VLGGLKLYHLEFDGVLDDEASQQRARRTNVVRSVPGLSRNSLESKPCFSAQADTDPSSETKQLKRLEFKTGLEVLY
jgi:hypothetical protein